MFMSEHTYVSQYMWHIKILKGKKMYTFITSIKVDHCLKVLLFVLFSLN